MELFKNDFMNKKILIIGGAGLLGKSVAQELLIKQGGFLVNSRWRCCKSNDRRCGFYFCRLAESCA